MATRREFLQKFGYSLVFIPGVGWLSKDASAASLTAPPPLKGHLSSDLRGADRASQLHPPGPGGGPPAPPGPPPGPPDPPPPPPPGGTTFVANLWDGETGVTPTYFNAGALLFWENKGGDWTDALGVAQGSTPFATGGAGSAGPFTLDVTSLAKWLHANSSYGMFLKVAGGTAWVATRANADPALRPVLTVIDTKGVKTVCACAASAVINLSSSSSVTGEQLSLGAGGAYLLEFDLDAVPNPIANATLTLTITKSYSTPLKLNAFALRSAKLFDGGTPMLGLAAKYTGDAGILADPNVYFATYFDTAGLTNYFPKARLEPDSTFGPDPDLGVPALGAKYHVGKFAPFLQIPDHTWSEKNPVGLTNNPVNGALIRDDTPHADYLALGHPHSPGELYFRYYLKLKKGYQCTSQGKKLPGLAGRYGVWVGTDHSGYYNPTAGNGGSPTKGIYTVADGFSGWSMRHHAYPAPVDANPYADLVPLNYYAYHVKMAGYFGDYWRWGNSNAGFVNLEPDKWYCIEHYVKVNDVVGPFDALGNGTAIENGIVRGWLDGVLVFEKTNAVLRKHPAIKVDEVWLDHYHGGTTPAEAEHPFQMAALVVAKSYIGPMQIGATPPSGGGGTAATPAWLTGAALNQWVAIPGTELNASTDLSAQIAAGLTNAALQDIGFGDPRRGIMAYSGGTLKTSGSEMLIFGGGGAGAWAGNDVRGLRLEDDAPTWKTRVKPSVAASVWQKAVDPSHAYMKDGRPNARHSYRQPQFIDATDTFYSFGARNTWEMDSSSFVDVAAPAANHYPVNSVSLVTQAWAPAGSHPDLPRPEADDTWTAKNPVTEEIYASTGDSIYSYSHKTNVWSLVMGRSDGVHSTMPANGLGRCLAAYDSTHGRILLLGWPGTDGRAYTADLSANTWTAATLSGPYASAISVLNNACPLIYDPGIDKYLLFVDDGSLYTLTWMSNSSYSVDRLALSGTPPVAGASTLAGSAPAAIWSRMQYVPNLRGVCILQAYNKPAYFVKTS